MTVIYRISDSGYLKQKPEYINNVNCLLNASKVFQHCNWHVIVDNVKEQKTLDTISYVSAIVNEFSSEVVSVGHGAGTFNLALDYALQLPINETVYFLENDYLHLPGSIEALEDMFSLGADYTCLYRHPDKHIPPSQGGNPQVDEDGGYLTKLYQGEKGLYFLVNSTTMTFAAKVKTLREDEQILRDYTKGTYPQDYLMFLALRDKGRSLLCPTETKATHGEVAWLSKGVEWDKIC